MPRSLSDSEITAFREKLCDAAMTLFAKRGIEGITMRELAAALGVSAMTPYRYFKDKNEILAAIRARAFDRFADNAEAAYDGDAPLMERVTAKRDAYIRFALEHKDNYRLMFDLAQPDEEQYPDLERASNRARSSMFTHARDLVAAGVLVGDPVRIAHALWSMLHGAVSLHLAGKLGHEVTIETLIEDVSMALFRGFSPPGAGPPPGVAPRPPPGYVPTKKDAD